MNAISGWISGQIIGVSGLLQANDYLTSGSVPSWLQTAWDRWGRPMLITSLGLGLVGEMIERKVQQHLHEERIIKPIDSPGSPHNPTSGLAESARSDGSFSADSFCPPGTALSR